MRTIITLIFTSFIFTLALSQHSELSLRLEEGKEYKQITNSTMTVVQDIGEMKLEFEIKSRGALSFLVKQVNKDSYDMEATLESMSMSMKMPQGMMQYDSEKDDPNDILSSILGEMKGKVFDLTMSKQGKVIEVKQIDTIWNRAINQFEELSEKERAQMKAQIMNNYSGESLKRNIEMATAIYPDRPVKKGDKWNVSTLLESGMSANISTEYEFADLTEEYAVIRGSSKIETADTDSVMEKNGIPMNLDLAGTMQSEIKVDRVSGWIVNADIDQQIEGGMRIMENDETADGMQINMSMILDVNIKNQ